MVEPFSVKPMVFEANSVIFEEGNQAEAVYLIKDGLVEIRIDTLGDHPQTLATRGMNDVIGEMALFDGQPHMASAVAVERTNVLAMSRQEFCKKIDEMDPIMKGTVLLMVKRLRQTADDLSIRKEDVNWANWKTKKY